MLSRGALLVALYAAVLVALDFYLFGNVDLNLADEGYLWYGVLRTLEGEVPLRDFQSYEPGRYYWCVAWSSLFGSGILGVRVALAIFQAIGLIAGITDATATGAGAEAVAVFFVGWSMHHYYLDAKIWRVSRDPGLAASLQV